MAAPSMPSSPKAVHVSVMEDSIEVELSRSEMVAGADASEGSAGAADDVNG